MDVTPGRELDALLGQVSLSDPVLKPRQLPPDHSADPLQDIDAVLASEFRELFFELRLHRDRHALVE